MNETTGLPKLKIAFEAAAQAVANRSKKGYVGLIVRDEKAQGLHKLSSDIMVPLELGETNKAHVKTAFEGSDRGRPSLVYLVVIPPAAENDRPGDQQSPWIKPAGRGGPSKCRPYPFDRQKGEDV